MAVTAVNTLRVFNAFYMVVDKDPATDGGIQAGVGSLAIGPTGIVYEKTAIAQTSWTAVVNPITPGSTFLDGSFLIENTGDITKTLNFDLGGQSAGMLTTLAPLNTSNMIVNFPQVQTAGGNAMALLQDETTGYIFSYGVSAPIGGSNSMMQLANASVANRAQVKLFSYFNGASVAGISTLTSRSGVIGTNTSLVVGQDYSKWTAQAAGATPGSAPISGTWAFKVNSFYTIGVTPYVGSDFHIQMLGSADGVLKDKLYITADGIMTLSGYTAGFMRTDAVGLVSSSPLVAADIPNVNTTTKSANYPIVATDGTIFCNTSGGAFTLTLPAPATAGAGKIYRVIDTQGTFNTNNLTLAPNGAEKISGLAANKLLQTNWGFYTITTDGTDWFVG
jgi:hypothetical protein